MKTTSPILEKLTGQDAQARGIGAMTLGTPQPGPPLGRGKWRGLPAGHCRPRGSLLPGTKRRKSKAHSLLSPTSSSSRPPYKCPPEPWGQRHPVQGPEPSIGGRGRSFSGAVRGAPSSPPNSCLREAGEAGSRGLPGLRSTIRLLPWRHGWTDTRPPGVTWTGIQSPCRFRAPRPTSSDGPCSVGQASKPAGEGTRKPVRFFERRPKRCDHTNPMAFLKWL